MPDAPESAPAQTAEVAPPETDGNLTIPPELQAIIDKERTAARDAEKARKALQKQVDDLRQKSMTDQEKAVADAVASAKAEGRAEAIAELGSQLVTAEIRAKAAGRLDEGQLLALTEGLNLAAFLTEEGAVDLPKISRFVDGIAPVAQQSESGHLTVPDLGQGNRGTKPLALNGDPLLRAVQDKLGVK